MIAVVAQLGERQTEDLKVPGSIPGLGIIVLQRVLCIVRRVDGICTERLPLAEIAQLGERQTEDLKVPGSIPGDGTVLFDFCSVFVPVRFPVCDMVFFLTCPRK